MSVADELRQLSEQLTAGSDALAADLRRAGRTDLESVNETFRVITTLSSAALIAVRLADQLDGVDDA